MGATWHSHFLDWSSHGLPVLLQQLEHGHRLGTTYWNPPRTTRECDTQLVERADQVGFLKAQKSKNKTQPQLHPLPPGSPWLTKASLEWMVHDVAVALSQGGHQSSGHGVQDALGIAAAISGGDSSVWVGTRPMSITLGGDRSNGRAEDWRLEVGPAEGNETLLIVATPAYTTRDGAVVNEKAYDATRKALADLATRQTTQPADGEIGSATGPHLAASRAGLGDNHTALGAPDVTTPTPAAFDITYTTTLGPGRLQAILVRMGLRSPAAADTDDPPAEETHILGVHIPLPVATSLTHAEGRTTLRISGTVEAGRSDVETQVAFNQITGALGAFTRFTHSEDSSMAITGMPTWAPWTPMGAS